MKCDPKYSEGLPPISPRRLSNSLRNPGGALRRAASAPASVIFDERMKNAHAESAVISRALSK